MPCGIRGMKANLRRPSAGSAPWQSLPRMRPLRPTRNASCSFWINELAALLLVQPRLPQSTERLIRRHSPLTLLDSRLWRASS